MEKIDTFCQEDFLLYFFRNYIFDPTDQNNRLCNKLFDLFVHKSLIGIDSTEKLFENISNPLIKHLIKMSTSGGSEIHKLPSHFQSILNKEHNIYKANPTSLYFFKKHNFEETENCGISISDTLNYLQKTEQLSLGPLTLKVDINDELNEFRSWKDVLKKLPPRNSIVIADNYFLNNSNQYEKNIFDLLTNILPDKLNNQDFHLSIITQKELIKSEEKYNLIKAHLNSLNKPYNIKFGLFLNDTYKIHDRNLISNYFRINVGHSFEIFNNRGKPKKNTVITYFPINSEFLPSTHFKLIKSIAENISNAECIGEKENRLLDYFK